MEYIIVIIAALCIVVIYQAWQIHRLFRRVIKLGGIVRTQYAHELEVLRAIRECLKTEEAK